MLRSWPVLLSFAIACGGEEKPEDTDATLVDPGDPTVTDTDTDTDTDTIVDYCTATVVTVDPGNNAEAKVDTTVTAVFSEAVTDADPVSIMLHDGATGSMVTGALTLGADGLSATFTPDAPLAYETWYDVEVSVCDDMVAGGFTTVPPPVDPAVLPGRTYGIEYEDIVWTQPGNTSLLTLDVDYVIVQVDTVDEVAATIDSVAATASYDDYGTLVPDCAAAVHAPTSDFSTNPIFTVGPADLVYPYNGGTITIEEFTLDARFNVDGTAITDIHIMGLFDPEQVLAGLNCATAAALVNGTCVPCPSGYGDCLILEAEAAEAQWLPTLDVITECGL